MTRRAVRWWNAGGLLVTTWGCSCAEQNEPRVDVDRPSDVVAMGADAGTVTSSPSSEQTQQAPNTTDGSASPEPAASDVTNEMATNETDAALPLPQASASMSAEHDAGAMAQTSPEVFIAAPGTRVLASVGGIDDTGSLHWFDTAGEYETIEQEYWSPLSNALSPDRRSFVYCLGATFSPPYLFRLDEQGYVPSRELVGETTFMTAGVSFQWSDSGQFLVGWGLHGDNGEALGIYDIPAASYRGLVPVTDVGGYNPMVGALLQYHSDVASGLPAVVEVTDSGISEPLLQELGSSFAIGAKGGVWRLDTTAAGGVSYAPSIREPFSARPTPVPMARIQAGPKGVGAWAVSTEGKIYWYPSDEGPAEAIQHDGSASSVFGQTDDLVVFVAEGGGVRIVVDQATHVAKTFDNIPDGSMTALDSSHLWAGSDRAVVFGTDAGGPVATFPLPDTATNVNCGLDVSMRAVDGHLALPYKDNGVSTLALLNLSAPEAVIEMTIPSRGGNFGCVRYSLDGTQFAVAETGESGSVLYIGTWDGQLTPIYESSEPYITVRAMK